MFDRVRHMGCCSHVGCRTLAGLIAEQAAAYAHGHGAAHGAADGFVDSEGIFYNQFQHLRHTLNVYGHNKQRHKYICHSHNGYRPLAEASY